MSENLAANHRDLLTYGELFPGENISGYRQPDEPERFDAALRICVTEGRRMSEVYSSWRVTESLLWDTPAGPA